MYPVTKLLVAMVCLVGGTSFALSCGPIHEFFPRDGATNVPLNAIPRATYTSSSRVPQLRFLKHVGDDRFEVPFDVRMDMRGWVASFVPRERLDPNTTYTLVPDGYSLSQTFTTGTREDFDAPATPSFDSSTFETPGGADSYRKWTLQLSGVADTSSTNDQLLVLVLVHDAKNADEIIGATDVVKPQLDIEICGANFKAPDGASFDVGLQVMDLAGNVSGVISARSIEGQKGCSAAPGGALLILALAFFSRRRSRT